MHQRAPVLVPTLQVSLERLSRLPEDIKFIREKEGLGLTQMAHTFGVTKQGLWNWETGKRLPEEPLILLSIMKWADTLRDSTS
jgi:DNA-binding transcriptional regulator YiaG